jgi:hypothetical protein
MRAQRLTVTWEERKWVSIVFIPACFFSPLEMVGSAQLAINLPPLEGGAPFANRPCGAMAGEGKEL